MRWQFAKFPAHANTPSCYPKATIVIAVETGFMFTTLFGSPLRK
jgi:hypothetical protein